MRSVYFRSWDTEQSRNSRSSAMPQARLRAADFFFAAPFFAGAFFAADFFAGAFFAAFLVALFAVFFDALFLLTDEDDFLVAK